MQLWCIKSSSSLIELNPKWNYPNTEIRFLNKSEYTLVFCRWSFRNHEMKPQMKKIHKNTQNTEKEEKEE